MTGTLELYRKRNFDGLLVDVDIYINNQLVGSMSNGERKIFDLPPGSHIIKAKQRNKSGEQHITINENQTIGYSFQPTKWSLLCFASTLIAFILIYLYSLSIILLVLALLPGFIIAMYLVLFGRKKYFVFNLS